MQKRSIPGGIKILRNQQGNILILGVFLILVISILFAGLVEFGRIMLVREQLQTAADSAALAGAGSGTHRYVKINVVTNRGQKETCNEEECWCNSCPTVRVRNIVGNENELIDQGDWKNFCVPPCDCDSGDCWFELVSRDLMYDTHSMGWGTDPQEIKNIRNDLTVATREALVGVCYPHQREASKIFAGKSLEQMLSIISSKSKFQSSWMQTRGYSTGCGSECRQDYYCSRCSGCQEWMYKGSSIFSSKLSPRKSFVKNMIKAMDDIEKANTRKPPNIDEQYTENVTQFYKANLPKHAENATVKKIKVYGYEDRNSPYYPSVVVYATAKIKTLFPQWFKDDFTTTVCAQATTVYRDADEQKRTGNKFYDSLNFGKWRKLPDKACWVDF